jgi:hypothetical protein
LKEYGELFKTVCKFTMKSNSTNPSADGIIDMILKNILLSLAIFYAMKLINKSYSKKRD